MSILTGLIIQLVFFVMFIASFVIGYKFKELVNRNKIVTPIEPIISKSNESTTTDDVSIKQNEIDLEIQKYADEQRNKDFQAIMNYDIKDALGIRRE
jgi:hypothetical protein